MGRLFVLEAPLTNSTGEIGTVLKARLTDANKAVQTLALDIVSRIATGMGKPFEKQTKFFVVPITTVLSDQKAPTRALGVQTLSAIATACEGLESMVPGIATGLETANPLQKSSLLQWLNVWTTEHEPSTSLDLSTWASSVVTSLDDRNVDVRKAAQALLPVLITYAGYDYVLQQSSALKPASRSSAVPLIQAARGQAAPEPTAKPAPGKAAPPPSSAQKAAPAESGSPTLTPSSEAAPPAAKTAIKATGIRRKLPIGSRPESRADNTSGSTKTLKPLAPGLRAPTGPKSTSTQPPPAAPGYILTGTNPDARKARIGKDASRWIIESGPTRKELVDQLQSQFEGNGSKELLQKLFSSEHNAVNDYVVGLGMLQDLYGGALENDDPLAPVCLANIDLPLRYVSVRIHEPQSNLVAKCLDLLDAVLTFLRHQNYQLADHEAICFVPTIINKASISLNSQVFVMLMYSVARRCSRTSAVQGTAAGAISSARVCIQQGVSPFARPWSEVEGC